MALTLALTSCSSAPSGGAVSEYAAHCEDIVGQHTSDSLRDAGYVLADESWQVKMASDDTSPIRIYLSVKESTACIWSNPDDLYDLLAIAFAPYDKQAEGDLRAFGIGMAESAYRGTSRLARESGNPEVLFIAPHFLGYSLDLTGRDVNTADSFIEFAELKVGQR